MEVPDTAGRFQFRLGSWCRVFHQACLLPLRSSERKLHQILAGSAGMQRMHSQPGNETGYYNALTNNTFKVKIIPRNSSMDFIDLKYTEFYVKEIKLPPKWTKLIIIRLLWS